jgi:hypothetical protein
MRRTLLFSKQRCTSVLALSLAHRRHVVCIICFVCGHASELALKKVMAGPEILRRNAQHEHHATSSFKKEWPSSPMRPEVLVCKRCSQRWSLVEIFQCQACDASVCQSCHRRCAHCAGVFCDACSVPKSDVSLLVCLIVAVLICLRTEHSV